MYETFSIRSAAGEYRISIGLNFLTTPPRASPDPSYEIFDDKLLQLWPGIAGESPLSILAEEGNKTLDIVAKLIEQLRSRGANRKSRIKAYGGGIVQDLTTFTASSYMRGVEWIYCPTTLLGMVDSCIGGKSSLNVGPYKNIVGNYYPPKEIWIDVAFCKTLANVDKISGLCEAVKICFADEAGAFEKYLEMYSAQTQFLSDSFLMEMITLTLQTKKRFVEEDEFDEGIRLLLNFGHSIGHAIEAATQFSITHGVAVGVGMLAELNLSRLLGYTKNESDREQLLRSHLTSLLGTVPNLQKQLQKMSIAEAMRAFKADKKHRNQDYFLILAKDTGHLSSQMLPINIANDVIINEVFANLQKDYLL
jgi:3-dehydroquinate synthase